MVIAKAHKDSLIVGTVMFIILIVATSVVGMLIFEPKLPYAIIGGLFWVVSFTMLIIMSGLIVKQIKTKDIIIEYDSEKHIFIVNCIKKSYIFSKEDIIEIKVNDKSLSSLGPIFFTTTESYGKLIVRLIDNTKIVTPLIDNVREVYDTIQSYMCD